MEAAMGKGEAEVILGLGQPYTKKDLKEASRKAILQWHPDRAVRNGVPEDVANKKFDESQKATKALEALFVGKPDDHRVTPDPIPSRSTGGDSSSSRHSTGRRSAGSTSSSTDATGRAGTGAGDPTGTTDAAPGATGGWADAWANDPTPDADDTATEGVGKDSPVPEKASAMCHIAAQKGATIHSAFLIISAVLAVGGIYDGFQPTSHANTAFALGIVMAGIFAAELITRIPSRVFATVLEHYARQIDAGKIWARLVAYACYIAGKIVVFLCLAVHVFLSHLVYRNGGGENGDS